MLKIPQKALKTVKITLKIQHKMLKTRKFMLKTLLKEKFNVKSRKNALFSLNYSPFIDLFAGV